MLFGLFVWFVGLFVCRVTKKTTGQILMKIGACAKEELVHLGGDPNQGENTNYFSPISAFDHLAEVCALGVPFYSYTCFSDITQRRWEASYNNSFILPFVLYFCTTSIRLMRTDSCHGSGEVDFDIFVLAVQPFVWMEEQTWPSVSPMLALV